VVVVHVQLDVQVFSLTCSKAYITIAIRLRYNCNMTIARRIRLQISDRNYDLRLFDCDTTRITTRLQQKIDMFIFCSRRMEAGVCDTL